MRRYLYLVTAHEDETRVGGVKVMDQRMSRPEKNAEGDITVLDEDERDFRTVGQMVGLGYADFEDEADLDDRIADVIQDKLADVDEAWLEKAGHDPAEVLA